MTADQSSGVVAEAAEAEAMAEAAATEVVAAVAITGIINFVSPKKKIVSPAVRRGIFVFR